LGPHVWQHGAKKTTEMAHLDITHYQSLTKEEEQAIENNANRIINDCTTINKSFMDKAEAEKEYGFHLYQGGVVPGNSLRVVNIEGVDTEACCGTHCDSTAEVGWIKLVKTQRISDGIVRLYYVAHEKAISKMNEEQDIMTELCETWGVDKGAILPTANRFFKGYK
jgi:alanyl-tRNA synthetase